MHKVNISDARLRGAIQDKAVNHTVQRELMSTTRPNGLVSRRDVDHLVLCRLLGSGLLPLPVRRVSRLYKHVRIGGSNCFDISLQ